MVFGTIVVCNLFYHLGLPLFIYLSRITEYSIEHEPFYRINSSLHQKRYSSLVRSSWFCGTDHLYRENCMSHPVRFLLESVHICGTTVQICGITVQICGIMCSAHLWKHNPNLWNHSANLWNHGANLWNHSANLWNHSANLWNHNPNLGNHNPNLGNHNPNLGNHSANLWNHVRCTSVKSQCIFVESYSANLFNRAKFWGTNQIKAKVKKCLRMRI